MSSHSTGLTNPWPKGPISSPWNKNKQNVTKLPCSLEEVMSEQLAEELEKKQTTDILLQHESLANKHGDDSFIGINSDAARKIVAEEEISACGALGIKSDAVLAAKIAAEDGGDMSTDELIARCLQRDFDREYNSSVDAVEKSYNGSSKVSISFKNYKQREHSAYADGEEDEDEDGPWYDDDYERQTSWDSKQPSMGTKGYSGQGKNIITKHDKTICGRRNAERLMEFPPEFESGDGEGMDLQLPNKVYNYLKTHSISDVKKSHKVHDKKEHSTAIKAVDERTRILMFKMVNSEFLSSIDGVINEGKEAVVFKAGGGMDGEKALPRHLILKVFKTTMNEFKTRAKYIYGDHRLSKDVLKKQNPRKIMRLWAEKEFLNLKRLRRHNMPCPSVLNLKKHVLTMTCIGGEYPAPKLKDAKLSPEHMQDAYQQTVDIMKRMYNDCGLVHADLSEYNLLWHDDKVWVIDVSQSREKVNSNSLSFLLRDCENICDFFRQAGVHGVSTAEELFMDITNYSLDGQGKVFEAQVERYSKEDYAFDFYFQLAEAARLQDLNKDGCAADDSSESDNGEDTDYLVEKSPPTKESSIEEKFDSNIDNSVYDNSSSNSDNAKPIDRQTSEKSTVELS